MHNDLSLHHDPQTGFSVIGTGDLGGKTRGLVFLNTLLEKNRERIERFPNVQIAVPDTLVLSSTCFEQFVYDNRLDQLANQKASDDLIAEGFLAGQMPVPIETALSAYLKETRHPLAVRSSGMLEDAQFHAYAGLYRTYMLSNDQPAFKDRLNHLMRAVKLIFASTFFNGPKAYARRVGHAIGSGGMAVIVQKVAGRSYDGYYFPAISGVAQSRNYYPFAGMKPEFGLATIALGLGEQVVSGERALRFCPKFPKRLPQRGTVEETLAYAQRHYYALKLNAHTQPDKDGQDHMERLAVADIAQLFADHLLMGTYDLAEHRVRDTVHIDGPRVLTFSGPLKYNLFPLAPIVTMLLEIGEAAMGVPVEVEFAVDLPEQNGAEARFYILQMRPMTARNASVAVTIHPEEISHAVCYTRHAIGNTDANPIHDIVYIKQDGFDPAKMRQIAAQVAAMNAKIEARQRQYLLVGPGRWGSADPWLGIPVRWADISQVAAIVETVSPRLNAEPSQGAHFFHNLASLGISYLSVSAASPDHFDWEWIAAQTIRDETAEVAHVQLYEPVMLKVDGSSSQGVIYLNTKSSNKTANVDNVLEEEPHESDHRSRQRERSQ